MPDNPVPPSYRVDHLFLLVGSNPLPNYVAARLLLNPGGKLYLVHSSADPSRPRANTEKVAISLSALLREHQIETKCLISAKESNAASIVREVQKTMSALPKNASVGLHYTGGTKIMSVYAYRTMERWAAEQRRPVIFSYLDARSLSLVLEVDGDFPSPIPVSTALELKIRELTALHGMVLADASLSKKVIMPDVARALALACASEDGIDMWRQWCRTELRGSAYGKGDWKKEPQLREISLEWPTHAQLRSALEALAQSSHPNSRFHLQGASQRNQLTCEKLCRWLDGAWLEHYVLRCLGNVAAQARLHDYGMNIETKKGAASHHFEMDAAAMRGYQLFAMSCTTDPERGKSKLFEAMIRAQDLGGDEACTGLIALIKDPDALQRQVEEEWRAGEKIRVFGLRDMPDLATHLHQWFVTGG